MTIPSLCGLFPLLFGFTLALLLLWAGLHLAAGSRRDPTCAAAPALGILWLTPTCARALGRCSQPGRLRSMSADCISQRLHRYPFPPGERRPSYEEYSSWPEQASLICQGRFEDLESYQKKLCDDFGLQRDAVAQEAANRPGIAWALIDTILIVATLIFGLAAILVWFLSNIFNWCTVPVPPQPPCQICPPPKVTVVPLTISTDQYFEYAKSDVLYPEKLRRLLADRLGNNAHSAYTIKGFTDPIGNACYNTPLAKNRAEAVKAILRSIAGTASIEIDDPVVRPVAGTQDKAIADECFKKFQETPPPNERPLRSFTEDDRRACSSIDAQDLTPDHIWQRTDCDSDKCLSYYYNYNNNNNNNKQSAPNGTLIGIKRTSNFYNLTRCLAPLRKVEIIAKTAVTSTGAAR